jgi:hypothetical protein
MTKMISSIGMLLSGRNGSFSPVTDRVRLASLEKKEVNQIFELNLG